ncbi:unnamed protein product, partial [Hapterophycus canaliculatus]
NLYDSVAALCGAVVVGSCRIGRMSEVNLEMLRKEAGNFWDGSERRKNRRKKKNADNRASESDTDHATSSGRSSCSRGGGSESSSSNSSSSSGGGSSSSDPDRSTASGSDHYDGDGTDEESSSDGRSISSGSENNGSEGEASVGSSRSGCSDGRDDRGDQRDVGGGGRIRDGDALESRNRRGSKRGKTRLGEQNGGRQGKAADVSPAKVAGDGGRGSSDLTPGPVWKSTIASGGGSSVTQGQQYEKGATRACAAAYDRANYEETMSVFGRAVCDALRGQCVENIKLSRVLVVHLYNFIRHELAPFEHPRLSAVDGAAAAAGGRETTDTKKNSAAEKKARKEAEKTEAKRRARLGPKAAAEEIRKAKEAEVLREIEEEKRRRTQLPVLAGLSISAIARATACASPSPPLRPLTPFPVEITRTSVRLAWVDPPFPGEPPGSYEVESKGDLRGNSTWAPVFPAWYPTISSQPVNIPRRVPGLGLRYRVRACNHGGWGEASDPTEMVATNAWLEVTGGNTAAHAMRSLARAGGPRLVLARMRRYSASLLVQENGFHQLVAEFNKGRGIPRASLAEEVALVVTDAMTAFSQVQRIQSSGLLLLGWAARGKGEGIDQDLLPEGLVERCLNLVATAEKLHSMDVAVKSHAGWATAHLLRRRKGTGGGGDILEHRLARSSEDEAWAG